MNGIERRVMNIYRIKSDADKVWIKKEHSSDLVLVSVHGGRGRGRGRGNWIYKNREDVAVCGLGSSGCRPYLNGLSPCFSIL